MYYRSHHLVALPNSEPTPPSVSATFRLLGVRLDPCLTMRTHFSSTVSASFSALRQIRSIRRSIPKSVLITLIVSLVHSRLDYCCTILTGVPNILLQRLQSVLNTAARLVFASHRSEHISPLLRDLHWLRIRERIDYRLAVMTYRCLNSSAPSYLADQLRSVADNEHRARLRSASSTQLVTSRTRRKTLGDRAFPIAASRVWNTLPRHVTDSKSLPVFRRALKTELFRRC